MFRYLLVLYANVYGKIVAYVVVHEFVQKPQSCAPEDGQKFARNMLS